MGRQELTIDGVAGGGPLPDEWVQPPPSEARKPEAVLNAPPHQLRLFGGHYLEIADERKRGSTRTLNLAFLDDAPTKSRAWPRAWFVVAAACLLACAVLVTVGMVWHGAGLGAVAIASTVPVVRRGRYRLTFVSNIGRAAAFVVDVPWLRGDTEAAFADAITQRIAESRGSLPSGRERLAVEMAEHRRLLAEGSLSSADYEQAKQRILAAFSSR